MKIKNIFKTLAITGGFAGALITIGMISKRATEQTNKAQAKSDKHLALFKMMNQWVEVKQNGKNLSEYFEKNGYKNIAIYGMSYAGECLINELKNSTVNIKYGIDKNADCIYSDIDVFSPNEELENVDAVIVTSIFFMDEIEEMMSKKLACPIISLLDVLCDM